MHIDKNLTQYFSKGSALYKTQFQNNNLLKIKDKSLHYENSFEYIGIRNNNMLTFELTAECTNKMLDIKYIYLDLKGRI